MKQGDFTALAKSYTARTGYSPSVLDALIPYCCSGKSQPLVVDVGAGTGKLTEQLLERKLNVIAVEPNDAMRAEGRANTAKYDVRWISGSGEQTNIESESCDWVTMASAFHWVDPRIGLTEFHRMLKPAGHLTVMWNPRDLERNPLQNEINQAIHEMCPKIERKSSGSAEYTQGIEETLLSTGHFSDVLFVEGRHEVSMNFDRYMEAWHSVNDIQAQAGPAKWQEILKWIANRVSNVPEIVTHYRTRSWTATRV